MQIDVIKANENAKLYRYWDEDFIEVCPIVAWRIQTDFVCDSEEECVSNVYPVLIDGELNPEDVYCIVERFTTGEHTLVEQYNFPFDRVFSDLDKAKEYGFAKYKQRQENQQRALKALKKA